MNYNESIMLLLKTSMLLNYYNSPRHSPKRPRPVFRSVFQEFYLFSFYALVRVYIILIYLYITCTAVLICDLQLTRLYIFF